jgi:ABC-type sugar transport system ATPase subunit
VYQRDSGRILLDGEEVQISRPSEALNLGVVTIYQETNLAPELTVAENILMGRWPSRLGWIGERSMFREAQTVLDRLGTTFDARARVRTLSPAQRQMTEIARAMSIDAKIIILDEPSASLTEREVGVLMRVLRQLREQGVAVIYITHRLEEVFAIADRATVLRDGQVVATQLIGDLTMDKLVAQMVGREINDMYPVHARAPGEIVLNVQNLTGRAFSNVSFNLREAEIVGMFGLVGSGRTDVARAIFGADKITSGTISLGGKSLRVSSPQEAIRAGIALAPEDRKTQGLVLDMPVRANITLQVLRRVASWVFMRYGREKVLADRYRQEMSIRTPSIETMARSLSGGNQQKVVVAKCLAANPRVLILDEPTRGIDVAGKSEVHKLVSQLADLGVGILIISSELPEIMGMSDRILVMHEGRLMGDLPAKDASEELIMSLASGQSLDGATA